MNKQALKVENMFPAEVGPEEARVRSKALVSLPGNE